MLQFRKNYFLLALLLLCIEIFIAVFVHDRFIRPYVGDFLVVILIYCFIRAFLNTSVTTTALFALLFAYTVETAQYFNLANLMGLQDHRIAQIIIGNSFEWMDILAYTLGFLLILIIEHKPEAIS